MLFRSREGYERGYADADAETKRLQDALGKLLEALRGMPEAIAQPLIEFTYETASRLAANISMERAPFVAAVQEALMRLPRPGENLYLRLNAEEVETWKKIVDDPGLPFNCTILVDADVNPGHAYVEVSGARIDVGEQARIALVRAALGLDRDANEQDSIEQNLSEQEFNDQENQAALGYQDIESSHQDDSVAGDEVKPE